MTRRLSVLAVLVLALFALDRSLTGARERERTARNRVARLLSQDERAALSEPPALSIERPGEKPMRYAPTEGFWRALDLELAPADPRAIQTLIETFVEAEGILATRVVEEAPAYGINTTQTLRVSLLQMKGAAGPTPKTLVAFDVGKSLPGKEGSFVRKRGTKEVWAIDGDPRALLAASAPGLPPLLERGIVPSAWKGWQSGLVSVRIERAGEAGFELARVDLDPRTEGLKPGEPPWKWVLDPGGPADGLGESAIDAPRERAEAFAAYLQAIPYAKVLPRAEREKRVPWQPNAKIVLASREGESFTLEIGAPLADGSVPVWANESSTLFVVRTEALPLFAPERSVLSDASGENPWAPTKQE